MTKQNELIVADNAEKRLISEIRSKGFNVQPCKKGPDRIKMGIKSLQDYRLIVCGDSPNLITELSSYRWNDKKSGIPHDDHNHLIDPTRYAFDRLTNMVSIF